MTKPWLFMVVDVRMIYRIDSPTVGLLTSCVRQIIIAGFIRYLCPETNECPVVPSALPCLSLFHSYFPPVAALLCRLKYYVDIWRISHDILVFSASTLFIIFNLFSFSLLNNFKSTCSGQ